MHTRTLEILSNFGIAGDVGEAENQFLGVGMQLASDAFDSGK